MWLFDQIDLISDFQKFELIVITYFNCVPKTPTYVVIKTSAFVVQPMALERSFEGVCIC